jgi:phosphatidylglycerol:prolipoprotein diacylglycerol transferase
MFIFIIAVFTSFISCYDTADENQVKTPIFYNPSADFDDIINGKSDAVYKSANYRTSFTVAIGSPTEEAKIYYTEDGSTPTRDSEVYTKPIPVSGQGAEKTIKAIAVKEGMKDSKVATATYTVNDSGIYYPEWLKPSIPGLPIHWYGLMYVFVAVTAYILLRLQVKKNPQVKNEITVDDIDFIFIWGIIGAILGARLAHVFFIDPFINTPGHELILSKPWRIIIPFNLTTGEFTGIAGMSFYGGIFGVILTVLLYCKRKKISFIKVGDMIAAAFPLGYTFGRLGNFFNQEFKGIPAPEELPWKIYYWRSINTPGVYENVARHPNQIYEALIQGVILWLVLWFIIKPRKLWNGFLMASYIAGYGIARFITEFFRVRNDPLQGITILTTSQWICIGLVILGIVVGVITKNVSDNRVKEQPAK